MPPLVSFTGVHGLFHLAHVMPHAAILHGLLVFTIFQVRLTGVILPATNFLDC